ncbi:MAG: NADH-quinone oxidoreductase subunit L [Ilumatobacteraceae bacterium]|nr:NADH-quinone oxidoreductase subunit L [Ilumatobacteraceae bacterium]
MLAEEAVAAAGWFLEHAWLIPLIPGVAFAVIILFGKYEINGKRVLRWAGAEIGLGSMVVALALAIGAAYQWIHHVRGVHEAEPVIKAWTWWQIGGVKFGLGEHIDGLAVMLLLLVTLISTLVQIYSLEYVRGDRRYTHFFASITLFSAGMLTMVLAENMVQLLLGWEIMGLCSFLLIGHWWEEEANARAALKAFLTVRVGDVGLLVGIAIMFGASGTFTIRGLHEWANDPSTGHTVLLVAAVALFIACIGKSGQFPLHTWLPDAMAGPTPVSSLLHSSTMVVAGVFLVARLYPVFHAGFMINVAGQHFNLIAVIGGITILIAAGMAFVQNDIKRVLAYSTVSQLGYMMMGLGVGAWVPAVFHLFTHAFFKCCLFLCAGSVSHTASHHSFDMKKDMGGLARKMPITFITWIASTAALCGVPFFSGFFSKDEIIDSAGHFHYGTFMVIGLIGAFLTTAYMTRATYLTFFGEPRGAAAHFVHGDAHHIAAHGTHDAHDAHEPEPVPARPLPFAPTDSPWLLAVPLMILGFLAVVAGYINAAPFKIHYFEHWLESSIGLPIGEGGIPEPPAFKWVNALPSIALVLAGFVISLAICKQLFGTARSPLKGLTRRNPVLGAGYRFLVNKYYLDHLYEKVIVRGIAHPIAAAAYWTNQKVLDGIVNAVGIGGRKTGDWIYQNIDQRLVDGAVNGSGSVARGTGGVLQPVQSGKVSLYGALLFGSAAVGALVLVLVNS